MMLSYPGAPPGWFYPPPGAAPDWVDAAGGLYTPDMGREERGGHHPHHHHHHQHHHQQQQQQQQRRDPRKRSRSKSQQKEAVPGGGRKKRKGPTDSDIERTYTGIITITGIAEGKKKMQFETKMLLVYFFTGKIFCWQLQQIRKIFLYTFFITVKMLKKFGGKRICC